MTLSLASAARLLEQQGLLREIIRNDHWSLNPQDFGDIEFTSVTYDSRTVDHGTLLFCKGRFKPEYMVAASKAGLACYVAETDYSEHTNAVGLIVDDSRKAMSLLSAEFFGRPQDSLTVVGITGTKGKTTTAYFTKAVLNAWSGGKAALFSSVDNCLDGEHYEESDLTTPESLDAFRMMRTAVDNGMKYLVMEVSSQAYKVHRVHGLTFDVGAFLNISPDHISPIEHPTFEDYFHCKRQIIANSRTLVLGEGCAHSDLIRQDAARAGIAVTETAPREQVMESHNLAIDGDFNYANAAAALAIAHVIGVPDGNPSLNAMDTVRIAGRMEQFHDSRSNTVAIVDYAHNYASVNALLDFVDKRFGADNPHITLVTGSAGNKAYDRRDGIVNAAQSRIDQFVFTTEDSDTEPYLDICRQMQGYVTAPNVESTIIVDRTEAVIWAVDRARERDGRLNVLLLIGKGDERWIKDHNRHVAYEGDDRLIARLFGTQE
ncbi:UDP-N-acetylmuramoylalanyl-D-glutamate--2,6-diaminopimelate ligase [Bifidobacterium sp. UTCIF-39]|uniref:UDP-N-acetylmuramoyl-L-alanyl-D-glutamate--2, 6-diaminopimelate ligase n=1 Tax=Bifidobacterium sp. UTCIF-39 TaxID=1465359 RepID=UPI001128930D|nr:UDP-N-acetylmuramoyl-L-alanyl-D-glutamate--2,6-diaminopimelate ligase [Bifidobacterium sp. UTCIF-39]TPF97722.1 UDP-N-acetylmuramoylalanyl-D-glutamate--2,6-diaminopimelate ligase [Bifidobacterium sp. UTCIF-39]